MKNLFAHTELGLGCDYPAYISINRDELGLRVTVRSAGNGGRDLGEIRLTPEQMEGMAMDVLGALNGESPIAAKCGLDFGEALRALKAGKRVSRAGWNGKGMWISMSGPLEGFVVDAQQFWSPHNAAFARQNGGSAKVLPSITMKTATGEILMGWLASQTDMLADDWQIV